MNRTRMSMRRIVGASAVAAGLALTAVPVFADGTETLGPPSIPIASGTGVVASGVGMIEQPGTLTIDVPPESTVEQVLLYWEGHHGSATTGADDEIVVDGTTIAGVSIGGPTFFFNTAAGQHWSTTYRADITALGLIVPGPNSLAVSGLDFDRRNNGAGVLVIHDDGGPAANIGLADGNDLAFINFAPTLDTTVAQTFTFDPAPVDRIADVDLFFSSVHDQPNVERPTVIVVTVGGTTTRLPNLLDSNDGDEWDTIDADVTVPAGADSITIQALSADDNDSGDLPASFAWIGAAAAVPAYVPPTTTVPPTTEPPTTTPPTTEPPVIVPPTTEPPATLPPPTAPTTLPAETTTSVAQAAVTTSTVAPILPATGPEGSGTFAVIGALLLVLGGILLLGTRRRVH